MTADEAGLFDLDLSEAIANAKLAGQREIIDRIRELGARRLPELARRLGLPSFGDEGVADLFDCILGNCGIDPDDPRGDDPLGYEWPVVGAQLQGKDPKEDLDRGEEMCNRVSEILTEIVAAEAAGKECR